MSERWSDVDTWFSDRLHAPDSALDAPSPGPATPVSPRSAVSAAQGKVLHLLARMAGARRVLEIGTLGGYSAIWLARALPADGRVVTVVGPALETLPGVRGPFDLVFVDADKENNAA